MQPAEAAQILLRRRRMRESLVGFAQSIQIPGAPVGGDDSELFLPVGTKMAKHHVLLCEALQKCIETDYGRTIVMMPPGAAKSTYASAIAPAWAMGRKPGFQVILGSYGSDLAKKHGLKARNICKQSVYLDTFGTSVSKATSAAEMWALSSGSEYMSGGLQSGLTGNRADLLIIDDPIKGILAADSPTIRQAMIEAIQLDAMTRLKPRASVFVIGTRWHPLDPIGALLPEDYDGRSGPIVCTDGMTWNVINIQAECEREDDPLGRPIGAMLWPEWFDEQHWMQYRKNARMWDSLFQQRPSLTGGGRFDESWIKWYGVGELPPRLNFYGTDDYGAPNPDQPSDDPDFTEMGIAGVDSDGHLWFVDWWYEQGASTDKGITNFMRLAKKWLCRGWFGEKGVIHNAIAGNRKQKQRKAGVRCVVELLPSNGSKILKAEAFFALCEQGRVHLPDTPWARRLVAQLQAFPVVAHDDGVDVCALFGRAIDKMTWAYEEPEPEDYDLKPFSVQWLEYRETQAPTGGRTR